MKGDERMLWELFCTTGEPQYYSMYVKARDESRKQRDELK